MKLRIPLSTLCLLIAVVALLISVFLLTARHNAQLVAQAERFNAQLIAQAELFNAQLAEQRVRLEARAANSSGAHDSNGLCPECLGRGGCPNCLGSDRDCPRCLGQNVCPHCMSAPVAKDADGPAAETLSLSGEGTSSPCAGAPARRGVRG